jgi:homoserine kinase type II
LTTTIAGKYALEVTRYEPLAQGVGNSNYLINTDQGKHILTVFEIKPARVTYLRKILLLLEKHSFPAPRVKYRNDGSVLAKYQEKAVMIKPYIRGQVLKDLNEGQVYQAGTALAELHEIPAPQYLPAQHVYVEKFYPKVMEQEFGQVYREWARKRHRNILENLPAKLPVGLVHGDLFCDNLLFEDGNFKAILDFEEVSRIYKVFDLGMAIVGICTEDTEIMVDKARALVAGYQDIRLLAEAEVDSLQDFIEWAAVLTSVWRFWKYKIDMPDIEKPRKYTQMVDIAKNASAIPKDDFKAAVFS